MDAVIFIVIALILTIKNLNESESVQDTSTILETESSVQENRVAKLNDAFYEDPNAFSEIINALGFPKE